MRTVSIIIPTYNRAHLVRRAIDTALAQTYPCEVIVCDHGSTDATPAVAAEYQERVRYIRRDADRGPIFCWRDGIEQASGECIHITYDDDWLDPTFIEKTIGQLRGDVAFVYTRAAVHADDSILAPVLVHPAGIRPVADVVRYLLRAPLTISPGCALFRRSDALKNLLPEIPGASGVFGKNSGVGEDLLLFLLTTLDYACYAHVPEVLAHFLAHTGSITVGAQHDGKAAALARAYATAKQYYQGLPDSVPSAASPHQLMLDRLSWHFRSGTLLSGLRSAFVGRLSRR